MFHILLTSLCAVLVGHYLCAGNEEVLGHLEEDSFYWTNSSSNNNDSWLNETYNTSLSVSEHQILPILGTLYYAFFYTITVTCIILGVIGNTFFLYFFGNPKTRIYKTRDALYIRRLSTFDMLICIVILPYSILYEARVVKSRFVCKTMELIRHILTYATHLMLASYSCEIPRRISYAEINLTVNRGTAIVIFLAFFCSYPTLFLFEVIDAPKGENVSMEAGKDSCQMVFSIKRKIRGYEHLNILGVHYYVCFCICYTVTFILFTYKAVHYVDQLSTSYRSSVGVLISESGTVYPVSALKQYRWRQRTLRHSQTGHRIVLAEYLDAVAEKRYRRMQLKARKGSQHPIAVDQPRNVVRIEENAPEDYIEVIETPKDYIEVKETPLAQSELKNKTDDSSLKRYLLLKSIYNLEFGTDIDKATEVANISFTDGPDELSNIQHTADSEDIDSEKKMEQTNIQSGLDELTNLQQTAASEDATGDATVYEPEMEQTDKNSGGIEILEIETTSSNTSSCKPEEHPNEQSSEHVSKYALHLPWSLDAEIKSILKSPKSEPLKIESYKKTLMCITALDFAIVLLTIFTHLTLEENSSMLNFLHTKCVFSFYVFCVFDARLRMAMENIIVYYYSRMRKPKDNVAHE